MTGLLVGELRNLLTRINGDISKLEYGIVEDIDSYNHYDVYEVLVPGMNQLEKYLSKSNDYYFKISEEYNNSTFQEMISIILNIKLKNRIDRLKHLSAEVFKSDDVNLKKSIDDYNHCLIKLINRIKPIPSQINQKITSLLSSSTPDVYELVDKINQRLDIIDQRLDKLEGK